MKKAIRNIFIGLVIGGLAGFVLGYNQGRGAPLLTNPFEPHTVTERIRQKADEVADDARKRIHEATDDEEQ